MIFFENERACGCEHRGRKFAITYRYTWFTIFGETFMIFKSFYKNWNFFGKTMKHILQSLYLIYIYIINTMHIKIFSCNSLCYFLLNKQKREQGVAAHVFLSPQCLTHLGWVLSPNLQGGNHLPLIILYYILFLFFQANYLRFVLVFFVLNKYKKDKDKTQPPTCFGGNAWHIWQEISYLVYYSFYIANVYKSILQILYIM